MKVFLSWSGDASLQIARELSEWIQMILQSVEIFLSPEDIEKGARWTGEISRKLEESNYGLICLTKDNLTAPWLAFEAGALTKLESGRAVTLLFGVTPAEVKGPLSIFQHTKFAEAEFLQLLNQMNKIAGGAKPVAEAALRNLFAMTWPDRSKKIQLIIEGAAIGTGAPAPNPPTRVEEMLSELASLTRRNAEVLASHEQALKRVSDQLAIRTEPDTYDKLLLSVLAGSNVPSTLSSTALAKGLRRWVRRPTEESEGSEAPETLGKLSKAVEDPGDEEPDGNQDPGKVA